MKQKKYLKRTLALVLCLCWMMPALTSLRVDDQAPFPRGPILVDACMPIQK